MQHYRPDIDGLRAVAVLSVMLYHFGIPGFSGGFIGVDVFFVISGYLITSMIAADLNAGTFSLLSFYDRRIRRIFPAMLAVLVATMLAGAMFLLPGDFEALGTSTAYSAAALSNIYFLKHTGYFDRAAELLPLLHLWSLAVEEQFYLVWPLLLAGFFVVSKKRGAVAILTLALILISLGLSIARTATNPKAAFFLAHLRAWELGLGALIVFLPRLPKFSAQWKNELLTIGGAGLIVASAVYLSPQMPFPGLGAIPPCVGAALIVWPRDSGSIVGQFLSTAPMRFIGLISYSLYLWHWPILVFYRHYAPDVALSATEVAALGIASFAIATLSWRFIEQPARRAKLEPRRVVGLGLTGASATALAGIVLATTGGFPNRLPSEAQGLSNLEQMWAWNCPQNVTLDGLPRPYCTFGARWDDATTKAVLWGDSHAAHWAPILQPIAERAGIAVLLYWDCPAIVEDGVVNLRHRTLPTYTQDCTRGREQAIAAILSDQQIKHVILAASWTYLPGDMFSSRLPRPSPAEALSLFQLGVNRIIDRLSGGGRRIVLISSVPQWPGDPLPCAVAEDTFLLRRPCPDTLKVISRKFFDEHSGSTDAALRKAAAARSNVMTIIPGDFLCDQHRCASRIDKVFLYREGSHLRRNLPPETKRALADGLGFGRLFSTHSE